MTQPHLTRMQSAPNKAGTRLLAGLAVLVSAMLILTGCAGVNAGSTSAAAFKSAFADDPAIESMDLRSSNDLPWAGGFGGVITARPGLSELELRGLADRLGRYRAEHQSTTNSLSVKSESVQFPVSDRADSTGAFFDFAMRLRNNQQVTAAVLEPDLELSLTAVTPAAVFDLARILSAQFSAFGAEQEPTFALRSAADEVTLTGEAGEWIGLAEQVWLGAEQFEVTKLAATPARIELRVASEQDVSEAEFLAKKLLSGSVMQLAVTSDLVRLAEGASGDTARELLASLDEVTLARVLTSWSDDEVFQVTVRSLADAQPFAAAIFERGKDSAFSTIAIFVSAEGANVLADTRESGILEVFADPRLLTAEIDTGLEMLQSPGTETVRIARDRIEIGTGLAESDLGGFAPALKAAAAPGQWVCVNTTSNSNICVTEENQISAEDISYADHPAADSFVRAWNSAPALR